MLTLINSNRMAPPIAPVGLDYVAAAARRAGLDVELLDLCLAADPQVAVPEYFRRGQPELVGISFRNVEDCFWPGKAWYVPELAALVAAVRRGCAAPIVLGGVGFSIFAEELVRRTGADFGVRGDGEEALVALAAALRQGREFSRVPGLIWQEGGTLHANPPAWPARVSVPPRRDAVDNARYFRLGGQIGVETRRGCQRSCAYCAERQAKGDFARLRDPAEVADEIEALLAQGVDVLHLCDSEFNLPEAHARDVCDTLIRRRLGDRVRWYAYLAVLPFDAELAQAMRRAGCVGINFTADSANPVLLAAYRQPHRRENLAEIVRLCRAEGIAVMLDLLLGGPGETPQTAAETIDFVRRIDPDCAGASVGVRLYPGTPITQTILGAGTRQRVAGVHYHGEGPIDLLRPTFYISPALGERPAQRIRELIADDPRFFAPADDPGAAAGTDAEYNYSDNQPLVAAIAAGARGAYWDILRRLRA